MELTGWSPGCAGKTVADCMSTGDPSMEGSGLFKPDPPVPRFLIPASSAIETEDCCFGEKVNMFLVETFTPLAAASLPQRLTQHNVTLN